MASAAAAWFPLAERIFGPPRIHMDIKLSLADSSIFSRLYYATETWSDYTVTALRPLEAMQTRVARRISSWWNRAGEENITNLELRKRLNMPSVQCVLMTRRLKYLARLAKSAPKSLIALLQATNRRKHAKSWGSSVVEDLRRLQQRVSPKLDELPDRSWTTKLGWISS